jgi:hypothetical protein
MAHRITVTQLKCAVLDPQWRGKWLAGENPSTFVFSPMDQGTAAKGAVDNGAEPIGVVFGTKFHQETDRLANWLTSPAQLAAAAAIESADDLMEFLWRSSLQKFTDKLLVKGRGPEAMAFTERMRSYCKRLLDLKKRTKNFGKLAGRLCLLGRGHQRNSLAGRRLQRRTGRQSGRDPVSSEASPGSRRLQTEPRRTAEI